MTNRLHLLAWTVAIGVTGCATTPKPPEPTPAPAPAVQPLPQYMQEAGQAVAEGSKERARDVYRLAAKTYPTSKEPWLKLTEDYFDAGNYGQAILAAQEVIQRDPADSVATSILAVSGLRVSASALSALRKQQRVLAGGTRVEAEDLVKVLRDQLGEPVLVPRVVPSPPPPPPPAPPVRRRPAATVRPEPAAPSPVAPAVEKPRDPFEVLKK